MSRLTLEVEFYAELERRVEFIRAQLPYYAAMRRHGATYAAGFEQALHMVLSHMVRPMPEAAQGIDTRSATDAKRRGPKGESPVAKPCAQTPGGRGK